jgi:S1-C subfamily serine protease
MKYKGDELQKIKDSGVHVIVVSEGSGEEVQAARTACQTSHAAVSSASGGAQPSSAESATAAMLGLVVSTRAESAGPPHGAEIIEIIPNGPAEHAGMQVGNVINSVNDKSVATAAQFAAEMSGRAPGSEIRLDYMFKTTAMGWMATKKIITLREQK